MTMHVHGIGHFFPENEISNDFLRELDIGTDEEWILERVGIHNRYTSLPLDYIRDTRNSDVRAAAEASRYTLAETARRAAEMAIARAGIRKEEIGMVVAGSTSPDWLAPVEACQVARTLNLEVPAIDINSACTSLFASIHMLSMMDAALLPDYVLLVSAEAMTRTVNYNDRSSAVLWGDGAAAMVVSMRVSGPARITHSCLFSSPASAERITVPRTGHFDQQGRAVQMFAIRKTVEQVRRLQRLADPELPLHFVGHQANLRMLEKVCDQARLSPQQHVFNVDTHGNTGAASGASVISLHWDNWRPGDQIVAAGVGAGLTWGGYLLDFPDVAA